MLPKDAGAHSRNRRHCFLYKPERALSCASATQGRTVALLFLAYGKAAFSAFCFSITRLRNHGRACIPALPALPALPARPGRAELTGLGGGALHPLGAGVPDERSLPPCPCSACATRPAHLRRLRQGAGEKA